MSDLRCDDLLRYLSKAAFTMILRIQPSNDRASETMDIAENPDKTVLKDLFRFFF
jgi:hypothetical protein